MELNKIYNEDCLKTMAQMPDGLIDLVVTSPPYDGLRKYKGYSFDFENIAKQPLKRLEKKQRHIVRSEGATKYIRANYDTKPIKEIAEYLDTNYSMVQARIRQLGLKKPMIRKKLGYIQKTCKIMNIETGKVFENMSIAARSADLNINTFQAKIRKFGCYKKFIKVA